MAKNLKTRILKLCKERLSIYDKQELYILLLRLPYDDITFVKLFLDNYYKVNELPREFYKMFIYNLHSNRYNELYHIVLNRNIYELIDFLKGDKNNINSTDISPNDYFSFSNKQVRNIFNMIKNIEVKDDSLELKKIILKNPHWLFQPTLPPYIHYLYYVQIQPHQEL